MQTSHEVVRRLGRLAWLLDSAFVLPGTRFRFGVDALIGLLPGLGDALGVLVSCYIIREAAQVGASRSVIMRMALNVAVEGIVGLVPFAGDVFDAAWKANQRNVALLEAHLANPRATARASTAVVAAVLLALIAFFSLTALASFFLVRALWQTLAG